MLSNIPPCPGNTFPVSLIFSILLKYEINKSPTCAIKENKLWLKRKI